MKLVYIYLACIVISTSSLYAMETAENISWRFNINSPTQTITAFAPVKPDTFAYVSSDYSDNLNYSNDFYVVTPDNLLSKKLTQIESYFSAVKITPAGNLLYADKHGKLGFYLANKNEGKIFTIGLNSSVVSLQNNIIIKNSDKKLCKAIAAVGVNGDVLCIHDDNNFRKLNFFDLLVSDKKDYQSHKEIVVADIKPYSTNYELLPFVASAIRYGQNPWLTFSESLISEKYSKSLLVYNPVLNKSIILELNDPISDLCFLPNYNIGVTSGKAYITLFDIFKTERLYTIKIPGPGILCGGLLSNISSSNGDRYKMVSCISSACGKYIATINYSCDLSVWDVDTGACIYKKPLDTCACVAIDSKMAFSSDSNYVYVVNKRIKKIYNIKDYMNQVELSDNEHKNAIKMFMRHQRAKENVSILHFLRNRELGSKK